MKAVKQMSSKQAMIATRDIKGDCDVSFHAVHEQLGMRYGESPKACIKAFEAAYAALRAGECILLDVELNEQHDNASACYWFHRETGITFTSRWLKGKHDAVGHATKRRITTVYPWVNQYNGAFLGRLRVDLTKAESEAAKGYTHRSASKVGKSDRGHAILCADLGLATVRGF